MKYLFSGCKHNPIWPGSLDSSDKKKYHNNLLHAGDTSSYLLLTTNTSSDNNSASCYHAGDSAAKYLLHGLPRLRPQKSYFYPMPLENSGDSSDYLLLYGQAGASSYISYQLFFDLYKPFDMPDYRRPVHNAIETNRFKVIQFLHLKLGNIIIQHLLI